MSTGDFDDTPGSQDALQAMYREHPAIAAFVREDHKIDHKHDVPYIGGISTDGKTFYLDRHVPEALGKIPVAHLVRVHETVEYGIIRELAQKARVRNWQDHAHRFYEQAHHLATAAEAALLKQLGIEWSAYTKTLRPYYKPIEDEKLTDPPKDLSLYPYDGALYRLLWDFRRGKVAKTTVHYRAGGAKQCGGCTMFLPQANACTLVAGYIKAHDVCDKYEAKDKDVR